ncbi:MAG: hypothetical protein J0I12_18205 [Candidatus Eremiobacteraeota bacterium]|nr:hypothetical protein [Candidatus Eremiobacteraeota bacterium]
MKTLLLLLALTLAAQAQTQGVLSHIRDGRAVFLEGSETQTYEVTPDLAYKLKHRGLGSLWEYDPLPGILHSADDCGNDPEVQTALQTLNQFILAINAHNWDQAKTLTAAPLPGPFETKTLSARRTDWSLQAARPGRLLVEVSADPTPTRFTLSRNGTRWQIESFR